MAYISTSGGQGNLIDIFTVSYTLTLIYRQCFILEPSAIFSKLRWVQQCGWRWPDRNNACNHFRNLRKCLCWVSEHRRGWSEQSTSNMQMQTIKSFICNSWSIALIQLICTLFYCSTSSRKQILSLLIFLVICASFMGNYVRFDLLPFELQYLMLAERLLNWYSLLTFHSYKGQLCMKGHPIFFRKHLLSLLCDELPRQKVDWFRWFIWLTCPMY